MDAVAAGPPQPAGQRLVVRGLTDPRSMADVIWPAFVRDTATAAELVYGQVVDMARLRAEVADLPRADRPDLLIVANPRSFAEMGLLTPVDGIDAGAYPAAWTDPAGRWWPLYVQPIVFVYNAHYRLPPARWTQIVDDGWAERLVFEAAARMLTTGPAFAELQSAFGVGAWSSWLADLARLRPRQVADNERAVLEVATGSRWGGLSNWNVARRVRPGSPVRHAFLDPTPCIPGFGVAVDGGASADLARAFLRWLASPAGQLAYARTGRIPSAAPTDAPVTLQGVIPSTVQPLLGTADWAANPDPWVAAYEAVLPAEGVSSAGKLRSS